MQEEKGKTCHGEAVNLGNYDDFSASNVPFTFPKSEILQKNVVVELCTCYK